jgi:phage terminase large subunit GpA-like protein
VTELVIVGAAQTGKSEAAHNAVGYWIEHDPSVCLWLMPSFEDAKRRSRGAFNDMIRSTPALRAVVRGRRAPRGAHEAESTMLEKVYPGGSLILAGAGTPNSFQGVSARRAVADEFARFPDLDEGDSLTLIRNRTRAHYDGLVALISTPLFVDDKLDVGWKSTDQRRWHVRCESCGAESFVSWQDSSRFYVTFENKDAETARLTCPGCGAKYDEAARRRLVSAGRWIPTATPASPGARGYHVPATISLLGGVTLAGLVARWLEAREAGPAALQAFIQTSLAEPWEIRGKRLEVGALSSRLEDFGGKVPAPVVCLTAGVDVQIDRLEVTVTGWGRGMESWIVDAYNVPGDPSAPEVQEALLAALDERYPHADGYALPILASAIDAGYLPERVAKPLAFRRPRRLFAVKGVGGRHGEKSILKFKQGEPPVLLNVDNLKHEVAYGLELSAPGPGYCHLNRAVCDEDWLSQLTSEHRETRRLGGVSRVVWVEDRAANHALDATVYARAALKILTLTQGARTDDGLLARFEAELKRRNG